jgi:protoheme IX farnesyltransferase
MSARETTWTRLGDVLALCKPRVTALVLCTTAAGLWLAPGGLGAGAALLALLATAMTVAAANTLNCYLEREADGLMERTRHRPLPAGRLHPRVALWVGVGLSVFSVPALVFAVNALTGLLGALALLCYVLVYTPLKQKSPLALPVGAIPGALPPLMGWTAATGSIEPPGLVLFAILFFWQLPHFLAISLFRQEDYARAGFRIVPVVHGERRARLQMALWSVVLVAVSLAPYALRMAGAIYLAAAGILGAGFLAVALRGLRADAGRAWARSVFLASLVYLTVLFTVLMIDAA